jgi:hypothetical protein
MNQKFVVSGVVEGRDHLDGYSMVTAQVDNETIIRLGANQKPGAVARPEVHDDDYKSGPASSRPDARHSSSRIDATAAS